MLDEVNYGPLSGLVGTWSGNKGIDWSPEEDGLDENAYYETIVFSPVGDVENAEKQVLAAIHYHQIVKRKSDDEVFHNETGYWIWDQDSSTIMHSFTIPRGVCVLAGGKYNGETDSEGNAKIEVSAKIGDKDWSIVQAPFMRDNARTVEFRQTLVVGKAKISYDETTVVEIYGKTFEHTDTNELGPA